MERLTLTPFGRQGMTAGLLAAEALAKAKSQIARHDKWELFRLLCAARQRFGLSDRDLAVLNALLSFHKPTDLEDGTTLIVFPSNRALSERAHGMAESTLRRHLAALVKAGMILRHDSPNGKRYARRDASGDVERAFGFDLRPLLVRAPEIAEAAHEAQAQERRLKALREACVLMSRDAVKLLVYGRDTAALPANWDALDDRLRLAQRMLRRRLQQEDLEELQQTLSQILKEIRAIVVPVDNDREEEAVASKDSGNMSGNDVLSERHLQNSNKDSTDFEPCKELHRDGREVDTPPIPLALVKKACPDLQTYQPDEIQTWRDLIIAAEFVRGMLGISPHAWEEAVQFMGAADAAIVLACILQRATHIQSPGGYLRALTEKSARGAFSTAPMVMALLNASGGRAA